MSASVWLTWGLASIVILQRLGLPAQQRGLALEDVEHPLGEQARLPDLLSGLRDVGEQPAGREHLRLGGLAVADSEIRKADELYALNVHARHVGVVAPPVPEQIVQQVKLFGPEHLGGHRPGLDAALVERVNQRLGAVPEDLRRPVVVNPHLTEQRGDDDQVEYARDAVGVAGNVVDVRCAVHQQILRFAALFRIGIVLLQGVAGGSEQADIAIGESLCQLVELRRSDGGTALRRALVCRTGGERSAAPTSERRNPNP